MRKSDPIPNLAGRVLCDLKQFDASDFGVAFVAEVKTSCGASEAGPLGVFRLAFGGSVHTLALAGAASDPPGTTYAALDGKPSIDDDGFVAFRAEAPVPGRGLRLFLCDATLCPSTPPAAVVLRGIVDDAGKVLGGFSNPVPGSSGEFVFSAQFSGGCGVYRRDPTGAITTLGRKGDLVVGGGAALQCAQLVSMSAAGNAAFVSGVRPLPTGKPYTGLFLVQ